MCKKRTQLIFSIKNNLQLEEAIYSEFVDTLHNYNSLQQLWNTVNLLVVAIHPAIFVRPPR